MKACNITEEKFKAYKNIRETTQVDTKNFNDMAILVRKYHKIKLTQDECSDIYRNYSTYNQKWQ
jgi:hypothetical protein